MDVLPTFFRAEAGSTVAEWVKALNFYPKVAGSSPLHGFFFSKNKKQEKKFRRNIVIYINNLN